MGQEGIPEDVDAIHKDGLERDRHEPEIRQLYRGPDLDVPQVCADEIILHFLFLFGRRLSHFSPLL